MVIAVLVLLMASTPVSLAASAGTKLLMLGDFNFILGSHGVHMKVFPDEHGIFILILELQPIRNVFALDTLRLKDSAVPLGGSPTRTVAMIELVDVALSIEVDARVKAVVHILVDEIGVGLAFFLGVSAVEFPMHACIDGGP